MPKQIGWSQESNLLYDILMQLDRLLSVAGGGGGGLLIFPTLAGFPPVGDPAFIYLAQDTNKIYYWNIGTLSYVEISPGLTSVGLTMPSAFTVTNSPLVSNGTIAVTGAGLVSQYVRGDGSLADFPGSTGGGASVSYYINGGTNQGVFGGNTYYEMSRVADTGASVNFSTAVDGYVAQFITDAGDPSLLQIPGGAWNVQFYLNASSAGGTPSFYVELYKYDGAVFTLLGSSSANPEQITGGTSVDLYYTSVSVPTTTLLITDRLAIRVYVVASGRTITLYTQNGTLGEIITTFTSGMTALNGLTAQVQFLATGTAGTDFTISSSGVTHTFDLPVASAVNTGKLAACDWTNFNSAVGSAVEVLGAGTNSTIRCGVSNTAAGACAASLGGRSNSASASLSGIVSGRSNTACGAGSIVGAGFCNYINAANECNAIGSVIVGGVGQMTCGGTWSAATCTFTAIGSIFTASSYSFIGGGFQNIANNIGATVVGGCCNASGGCQSFVGGGLCNTSSGTGSITVGGGINRATGLCSVVVGGNNNLASCSSSFIGAGRLHTSSGSYSFVGGGQSNCATAADSTVVGGNTNRATGSQSFAGGGQSNCATQSLSTVVGGSTNFSCGTATYIGGGCVNVAFGNLSVVSGGLCNRTDGLWASVNSGCRNIAQAIGGFIGSGVCNHVCNNTSGCLAIGATVVGGVGNNTTGGTWAIATCNFTVAPTILNAGCMSFIGGGFQNYACSCFAAIGSGCFNVAGALSFVGSGISNSSSSISAIGSGCLNLITGQYGFIGGGACSCVINGSYSAITGGQSNILNANWSVIGGGVGNYICTQRTGVFSGWGNSGLAEYSAIVGGSFNCTIGLHSFIGGGTYNSICNSTSPCLSFGAAIVGGVGNNTTGGTWSLATCAFTVAPTVCNAGIYSFVGGGFQNAATGCFSAVLGGQCNVASGAYSGAFGCNLTASAACTFYTNNFCACGNTSLAGGFTMSTTSTGLRLPNLDTTQRNAIVSPQPGMTIYNTSTATFEVYNGSVWVNPVAYVNTAANLFNYYNFV